MFTRASVVILGMVLTLSLTACGGGGGGSSDSTTTTTTTTQDNTTPGSLVLDLGVLEFNAVSGQVDKPATQSVNVTSTGADVSYDISISYGVSGGGWLYLPTTATSGTSLDFQPETNLASGPYSAHITLTPTNGTEAKDIWVNYHVSMSELTTVAPSIDFTVDTTTTSADLNGSTGVGATGGALTWTATPSVPWLSVSPQTGSTETGDSLTVSLVASAINTLDVATHDVTITLTYKDVYNDEATLELPVSLDMRLPLFSVVSPYVAYTGRSEEVVIRGQGFNTLSGQQLYFGGTSTTGFSIVSDTEIRLDHPVLTTQRYAITAQNALGLSRSNAELVVVDAPTYSYTALPTTDSTSKLLFDPERQSIYAVKWDTLHANERIDRYTYNGTSWDLTSLAITRANDVTISPDGKELITLASDTLYHVDPETMSVTSSVVDNPANDYDELDSLVFTNSGNGVMVVGSTWSDLWDYDRGSDAFNAITLMTPYGSLYRPRVSTSLDRAAILLGENGVSSAELYRYNPETQEVSATGHATSSTFISSDRTGTHFCIDTKVYDQNFSLLGSLPSQISICSPDGTRAYVWDPSVGKIRTFDLDQSDGAGGFSEVGTGITMADSHGTYAPALAISQDGGTLFIGGNQNILIQPVP